MATFDNWLSMIQLFIYDPCLEIVDPNNNLLHLPHLIDKTFPLYVVLSVVFIVGISFFPQCHVIILLSSTCRCYHQTHWQAPNKSQSIFSFNTRRSTPFPAPLSVVYFGNLSVLLRIKTHLFCGIIIRVPRFFIVCIDCHC